VKIYYLAHPYSGDEEGNVRSSIYYTNLLLDAGYLIFNPLTHSHPLDKIQKRDPNFWYDLDLAFLKRFDGIIMTPDWKISKGCKMELDLANNLIKKGVLFKILYYEDLIK